MWRVTMLSTHRGIAVMEGVAGSDRGHDVSVWRQSHHGCDVSALSRSIPTLAAVWKMSSWEWVRASVGVNRCTHVAFVRFFVHVHALPFLWLIQMNDRVQSVPSSVVRTLRLSLFRKIEGYLCLYENHSCCYYYIQEKCCIHCWNRCISVRQHFSWGIASASGVMAQEKLEAIEMAC